MGTETPRRWADSLASHSASEQRWPEPTAAAGTGACRPLRPQAGVGASPPHWGRLLGRGWVRGINLWHGNKTCHFGCLNLEKCLIPFQMWPRCLQAPVRSMWSGKLIRPQLFCRAAGDSTPRASSKAVCARPLPWATAVAAPVGFLALALLCSLKGMLPKRSSDSCLSFRFYPAFLKGNLHLKVVQRSGGFIPGSFELKSSVTLGKLLNLSVPHYPPHQIMALIVAMLLDCWEDWVN